ncbi:MAG: hypothetical protein NTU73_08320, partial [Ignavibacteriae bacterium]|nr:hypothetical protein [Ignavibacteriota bacterium]
MEAQNKNILDKYFDSIKEENYKESFNEVEDWLRREAVYSFEKPEKSKFALLKYIFSEGRLKFAYLFIILILVGITSNFSVTRTEPVGIVMSWSVDKQNPETIKKIDNFDWIDKSKLIVNEENADGKQVLVYKMLIPSANMEEIDKLKSVLENMKDVHSVNVVSISEPVKQPLYAVALENIFKVDYNKNLANPEEIKNNVFEQLRLAGIQNDVDLDVPSVGSAGRFVNFNFGKKPDSIRIKIHCDIVNEYDIDKALEDVDKLFAPVRVINDSVLKKVIVSINGEELNTDVIMYEVQRNLDTLHFRLKNSETRRKEKMDRFNEKMERFNERMEKFNKSMEKFNKKMEKFDEKMEKLNVPNVDYHYEINDEGDINIEVDVDEIPGVDETPGIDEHNFNFNFKLDDVEKSIKINIDS